MAKRISLWVGHSLLGLTFIAFFGCSATGAAWQAVSMGKNLSSNRLETRIYLDGIEAKRNEFKQAATGYSRWKVNGSVTTAPKLKFEFKKPDALGRIRNVNVSIFQKFEADYSNQAEFVIVSRDSSPEGQMRPGIEYDLGSPGAGFRITDWKGNDVSGVRLVPGKDYLLNFTVSADQSETAQVYFTATTERPGMVGTLH